MTGRVAALLLVGMLVSANSFADDLETVRTQDGSVYRGELIEKVVDDHITIKLGTGEIKRFEWAILSAPQPTSTPQPVATPKQPQAPSGVPISFEADDERAKLQMLRGTGTVDVDYVTPTGVTMWTSQKEIDLYRDICGTGTCIVDPAGHFRVGGHDLIATEHFTVNPGATVHASMSTTARRSAGRTMTIYFGAPLTVVGALLLAVAPLSSDVPACDDCVRFQSTLYLWSAIVGGVGLGLLIPGIVLWAGAHSNATVSDRASAMVSPRLRLGVDGLHF